MTKFGNPPNHPSNDLSSDRLFSRSGEFLKTNLIAAEVIGRIAYYIFKHGGRLIIEADGPNKGITIESEGETISLNPLPQMDPEEKLALELERTRITEGLSIGPRIRYTHTLELSQATLRRLFAAEALLKECDEKA